MIYIIYALKSYLLFHIGLFYFHYVSGDVAQCETSECAIKLRASDVTYSEEVRDRIRLDNDSIKQCLISTAHLRVITVEIKCTRWTRGFIAIV